MKDRIGQELKIGDTVVFSNAGSAALNTGKIEGFTKYYVKLSYCRKDPTRVVKVKIL